MTIEEIFSKIVNHMTEGLMTHIQMANYFNFLGLKGYSKCHLYHFIEENSNYVKVNNYYIEHFNRIPIEGNVNNPNIIPNDWYSYSRQNVNDSIRKASIEAGFKHWIEWEKNTRVIYQQYYNELIMLKEVAAAEEIKKYIVDVDYEIAEAEQKELELKAIGYNISDIMMEQEELCKKYKKKIKEVAYDRY